MLALLSAKQVNTGTDSYEPAGTTTFDYGNSVKSNSIGRDFGLGYSISKIIAVDGRYDLGITNVGAVPGEPAYRSSVFSFNILLTSFGVVRYNTAFNLSMSGVEPFCNIIHPFR